MWEKSAGNVVHIGEHDYPVVKIGSLIWLAENLKEFIDNTVSIWYNNDSGYEQQKIGLLYDPVAISQNYLAPCLVDGWRLPNPNDVQDLLSVATPTQLRSKEMWDSVNKGTDDFGFNFLPAGAYRYGTFYSLGIYGAMWSNDYSHVYPWNNFLYTETQNYWYSVRLCKDA